ncbi:MAG: DUF559 domain-containing protein [Deltaproteobacteria bacterium]|nr:DUF559 domain-containing protein [Deltaproteobacteria bacterium]
MVKIPVAARSAVLIALLRLRGRCLRRRRRGKCSTWNIFQSTYFKSTRLLEVKQRLYNSNLKHKARKLRSKMTYTEQLLWKHLRKRQLLNIRFKRQAPLENFILDFYAPSIKLAVEVDGLSHDFSEYYDAARDYILGISGIYTLRISNYDVLNDIEYVVGRIREAILGRM